MRLLEEERLKREDKSRAVVLEMLGDLPSADITAPENVLFVCKLNPVNHRHVVDWAGEVLGRDVAPLQVGRHVVCFEPVQVIAGLVHVIAGTLAKPGRL